VKKVFVRKQKNKKPYKVYLKKTKEHNKKDNIKHQRKRVNFFHAVSTIKNRKMCYTKPVK